VLRTLILIPEKIAGLDVTGLGWLLIFWAILSTCLLGYLAFRQGFTSDTLSYLPMIVIAAVVIIWVLPKMQVAEAGVTGIPIRGYGVMLLLGVVCGVGLAAHRAQRMGVNPEVILSLAVWMTVLGIFGARVFYVIQYWGRDFQADTLQGTIQNVFNITQGGLVVYGSLIGAMLGFAIYTQKNNLPTFAMADIIAPSMLLGLFFGRIGCLLNGCCYGGVCEYPWAIQFPDDSPPYIRHAESGEFYGFRLAEKADGKVAVAWIRENSQAADNGLAVGNILESVEREEIGARVVGEDAYTALDVANYYLKNSFAANKSGTITTELVFQDVGIIKFTLSKKPPYSLAIHPAQLYSSLNAIILCGLMLAIYPYRRRDGEVIALTLTTYAISRFLLEIIRSDETTFQGTGLTISQNVSLVIFFAAIGFLLYLQSQPKQTLLPVAKT
jgi:phosphatidylglycerol:prolipoprotein diacylglycerol transferase